MYIQLNFKTTQPRMRIYDAIQITLYMCMNIIYAGRAIYFFNNKILEKETRIILINQHKM